MSLLDKFEPLRALQATLAQSAGVPAVATPMDAIHSAREATVQGRRLLLAGSNNYLGLTFDASCQAAAIAAIEACGTGSTGSRMASGNYEAHRDLERALAAAFGWPAGIVFSTGYQANLGTLSALGGSGDYLLVDSDSHASIHDGCRLSAATMGEWTWTTSTGSWSRRRRRRSAHRGSRSSGPSRQVTGTPSASSSGTRWSLVGTR